MVDVCKISEAYSKERRAKCCGVIFGSFPVTILQDNNTPVVTHVFLVSYNSVQLWARGCEGTSTLTFSVWPGALERQNAYEAHEITTNRR